MSWKPSQKVVGSTGGREYVVDPARVWKMSELTRADALLTRPTSRRREREQPIFPCSADHYEQDWLPYPVDAQSTTFNVVTKKLSNAFVTIIIDPPLGGCEKYSIELSPEKSRIARLHANK